ncbi:uncharacterized protein NEMAJ01_0996 [Nematocida major]|uniref:uncharacterized protein n=1 Tax=Nematocida major TaxID=1912982 RepID=UPI0020073B4B|nr:uncharacterized protein NEMAJ01_0996 [Nematocida major]KAH9386100.1 hypothetical protein NEMAJ01_0996 [Nematocida major]
MDYKAELQAEYRAWDNKKVKRQHRAIQVKEYTIEQIYHQVQNITDLAVKDVETYLMDYMNKEGELASEESEEVEESEGADEPSAESSSEGSNAEAESGPAFEVGSISSETAEEDSNSRGSEGPEDAPCGELIDALIEPSEGEADEASGETGCEQESSEYDYNSDELDDIYNYLEGGADSSEMLDEPARETLRKLRK